MTHGKLLKSAGGLELDEVIGIIGHQTQRLEEFNKAPIQLGLTQLDQSFKDDVELILKEQDSLRKEENEDQQNETPTLLETFKKFTQEATADGPAFGDIPLPP